jgi:glyoxylase-like metal-dependent hydrolase (beta-lactamase superfamily II)
MLQRQLGEIQIHRIIESEQPDFDPMAFFPETTPEDWVPHQPWLQPWCWDPTSGNLIFPMQSFLVRGPRYTILVDTCVGDHKERQRPSWHMTSSGAYLHRLAAAGVAPEEVDYVMCTHMHTDHVGWNTRLDNGRWVPTFPNAQYIMSAKEWAYWEALHKETPVPQIADSVLPIVEAGKAVLVSNDHAINDDVWLESTPGHTPDHVSVRLSSHGAQAVITGDLIHCPVQCAEPMWIARPDYDAEQARQTRRSFLERYCDTDVLVCATHFPSPSFGHIVPEGNAFRFQYEHDTQGSRQEIGPAR